MKTYLALVHKDDTSAFGLTFPDPALGFNEASGHWEHGPIDWEEFKRVVAGGGFCAADRLAARRKAHEEGAWVRDAAAAFAVKRAARKQAA